MPPAKSPPASAPTTPPVIPPSKTSHLFGNRKPATRGPITREAIAADLEAFRKAGGKIEVLGVTNTLRRIGPNADATPTDTPPVPAKRRRWSNKHDGKTQLLVRETPARAGQEEEAGRKGRQEARGTRRRGRG